MSPSWAPLVCGDFISGCVLNCMAAPSPAPGPSWTERGLMGAGHSFHLGVTWMGGDSAVICRASLYQEGTEAALSPAELTLWWEVVSFLLLEPHPHSPSLFGCIA